MPIYGQVEPHIYSLAESAVQNLTIKKDQTIIINDSDAGKTINAEHLLKYLIWRCKGTPELERKLIDSHYILECFGNAKTQINENSSRFGKFLTLHFKDDIITGGEITQYLLEKSRVTHQAFGNKNYHIFYMIIANLDEKIDSDYIRNDEYSEEDLQRVKRKV